jgi:hypothetical protein
MNNLAIQYHSKRKASMGLSLAARIAGAVPKIIPTRAETPNANPMDQIVTTVVKK